MDVELPDGTVLEGVPAGTTREQIRAKLQASGYPHMDKLGPPPAPAQKPETTGMLDRFLTGAMDPIVGLAQIADRTPIPGMIRRGLGIESDMNDYVRARDADYHPPEGWDVARLAGNVASPINLLGVGGTGAAGRVANAVASRVPVVGGVLAAPVGAATMGAVQGMAQPTAADDDDLTFAAKKLGQGALGAVLGRIVGGAPKTPEAEALAKQGVNVTRAQGAGGTANNIEEKLTSLPYAGGVIENARRKGASEFQDAVLARESGLPLPKGATVEDANKAISSLYEEAVPHLKPTTEGWDKAMAALDAAKQNPLMTAENKKALDGIVNKYFGNYTDLSGRELQTLQSELAHIARTFNGRTASPTEKVMAGEVNNVLAGLREGLVEGMPPEMGAKFLQANAGYRKLLAVNDAASRRIDEAVMPRALQKAMAKQARTDTTRMSDPLIDPALKVIERTVPDSGTAGRQAAQGLWPSVKGAAAWPAAKLYYGAEDVLRKLPQKLGPVPTREALARALVAAQRGANYNPDED
jgi:hypothetical protein